jgi:hypothetical protein
MFAEKVYEEFGSRQQALSCPRAARHTAVRYSSMSRPWRRRLVIAVNFLSTNRLPLSLFYGSRGETRWII